MAFWIMSHSALGFGGDALCSSFGVTETTLISPNSGDLNVSRAGIWRDAQMEATENNTKESLV